MYDKGPLYFKRSLPSGLFWFLVPRDQQARKEVTTLAGATDPGNQEEVSCCYIKGQGRICLAFSCSTGTSLVQYEVNGQV